MAGVVDRRRHGRTANERDRKRGHVERDGLGWSECGHATSSASSERALLILSLHENPRGDRELEFRSRDHATEFHRPRSPMKLPHHCSGHEAVALIVGLGSVTP